jgi:hypothetical protein
MSNRRSSDDDGVRLVQTARGDWIEVGPEWCPNGHSLDRARRGWTPCACRADVSGHATWTCRTCDAEVAVPPCLDETKSAGYWKR